MVSGDLSPPLMVIVISSLSSANESENDDDGGDCDDPQADGNVDGDLSRFEVVLRGNVNLVRTLRKQFSSRSRFQRTTQTWEQMSSRMTNNGVTTARGRTMVGVG